MNNMYDLFSIVMPILAAVILLIIVITLIVVIGKTKQTQSSAINKKQFEEFCNELRADNATIKSELFTMKEKLDSINKMMEEVQ